jgi:hypothetical protein
LLAIFILSCLIALQFLSMMAGSTLVISMRCSRTWIDLNVSLRKSRRVRAQLSPILLTLGAGKIRLTSRSIFVGRCFWVFRARTDFALCSAALLSVSSVTCIACKFFMLLSRYFLYATVCLYCLFTCSVVWTLFALMLWCFIRSMVCHYCRLSLLVLS